MASAALLMGARSKKREAARDVFRRRLDGDATNDAGRVTRALLGSLNINAEVCISRRAQLGCDRLEIDVVDGGALARDAVVVHGVDAIGGDVDFVDAVAVVLVDTFDGDAGHGEIVGELAVVDLEVNEVANP